MLKIPVAIMIAVVTLLGGFYGGYKLGQGQTVRASAANSTTGSGTGGGFGAAFGGGANAARFCSTTASPRPSASGLAANRFRGGATGTITVVTSNSITVHNPACNTDTKVTFDSSVIIRKTVDGSSSDLQENKTVTVQGQRQSDGSVKANSITIVQGLAQNGG
jgi:hypothetical protein